MKTFGHKRPVRDAAGLMVAEIEAPARAVTREELDGSFGSDRGRKLVVSLDAGDLVSIRPHGTRRTIQVRAVDLFRFALRCAASRVTLEKARVRKERMSVVRERRAIAAADRKLTQSLRAERARGPQ